MSHRLSRRRVDRLLLRRIVRIDIVTLLEGHRLPGTARSERPPLIADVLLLAEIVGPDDAAHPIPLFKEHADTIEPEALANRSGHLANDLFRSLALVCRAAERDERLQLAVTSSEPRLLLFGFAEEARVVECEGDLVGKAAQLAHLCHPKGLAAQPVVHSDHAEHPSSRTERDERI